ncbi:anti-sigma factor domain-containing protein [Desulforamulus ferrireducens]|uniref:RsgI N-terminal anti-sigma domain-containing protein n=1 Tax=Desulforamulus ferrireducens TaxID=1833852 RepID=A0A1S6IY73_9FIRM|nr:anti-sigma factor domain-containing protein [Desulforamulus ferrireducens]AQS59723.1 hypothetical protein B0537_11935 [Desulforamulus ferrireducens]
MVKGILLETKGPFAVVLTADGRFVRIILTTKNRTLGQEVTGRELRLPSLKQGLAVASVLLVIMVGLWAKMLINPAVAYVALDINPSLELAVNEAGLVIKAQGLDQEGKDLLAKVNPKNLEIYQAVELLVEGAAQNHYLNDTNNVVLTTVTPVKEDVVVVDEGKLQTAVQKQAEKLPTSVKVVSQKATLQEHQEAVNKGLSVGRYLIHRGSVDKGEKVSLEEAKSKGLGQLEKEKGIKLEQLLPRAKHESKVTVAPPKEKQEKSLNNKKGEAGQAKDEQDKSKSKSQDKISPGQLKKQQETKPVPKRPEVEDKVTSPATSFDKKDNEQRRDDRRHGRWEEQENTKQPDKKLNRGQENNQREREQDRNKDQGKDKKQDKDKGKDKDKDKNKDKDKRDKD